jgi:hypothetical protein
MEEAVLLRQAGDVAWSCREDYQSSVDRGRLESMTTPQLSPFVSLACRRAYAELAEGHARVFSDLVLAMADPGKRALLARVALQELDRIATLVDSAWIQDEPLGLQVTEQDLGELAGTIEIGLPEAAVINPEGAAFMTRLREASESVARFAHRLALDPPDAGLAAFDDEWTQMAIELDALREAWRRARSSSPDRGLWEQVSGEARGALESMGATASVLASWCFQASFSRLRFEPQRVTVVGALSPGEYSLTSTASSASESVEISKLGGPGAEPRGLGRIYRFETALPQFVPDPASPLGFMPALAALKLIAAGYFIGGGRERAGDVYVVFPDGLPPEHPNAHAVIGRAATTG